MVYILQIGYTVGTVSLSTTYLLSIIIYIFLSFAFSSQVHANDDTNVDKEEIRRLVKEVMEEDKEERGLDKFLGASGIDNMIFHGYVDLEWKTEGFTRGDGNPRGYSFFDNHHFNLWFGYLIDDNLLAKNEVEIEHAGKTFKLEFGDIEWKPFNTEKLELLMGMILVPLGIENTVHASVWNKLISRPLPSVSIIPGTYADVGIEARGKAHITSIFRGEYHLYLVNGIGDTDGDAIYEQKDSKNPQDNNRNKAIGLQASLLVADYLNTGISGYFGQWDNDDKHETLIAGTHIIYDRLPFNIRGEFIYQEIERPIPALGIKRGILKGYYVQGTYMLSSIELGRFLDYLELVTRYESMSNLGGIREIKQGDIPQGGTEGRFAAGIIFRPHQWLQLKLEYLIRNGFNLNKTNGIALQAVANW